MDPFHAANPGPPPPERHLGSKTAGMVGGALVVCLLITGGLLFSLIGANSAIKKQRFCPPGGIGGVHREFLTPELIRTKMREMSQRLSTVIEDSLWLGVLTGCVVVMVIVSLLGTVATLAWLKHTCTEARSFKRATLGSSRPPDNSPPPYNPLYPHNSFSTGGGVVVVQDSRPVNTCY